MCRVRYFLILLAVVLFVACSADFNEFGKSDYKTLNDLAFEYQTSSIQIYETEHLLIASFPSKDSGSYDSLTFETIDISSLSDLFLVKSKVASVPSDSAGWEDLAEDVTLADKPLEEGSKIRLPSSREIYLAVVSESGKRCVWRLQVKIEGEVLSSSSASDDPQSSSSSEGNVSASSSSAEALNANTDLQIKLKGEVLDSIIPGASADTLFVLMPLATDIASSELDTAIYSLSSRVSPDPKTISDWSKKTAFTVTAEDSSVKKWVVSVSRIKNTSASLYITFENQFKQTKVDSSGTILVKLPYGSALSSAKVESDSTSFGAGISPSVSSVSDWSSAKTFTVTAEDGTVKKWTVTVEVAAEDETASSDKDLLSISAAGEISDATVNSSKKTVVFHLANKAALANVSIAFSISSTASASPASGSIVDLSSSKSLTITAEDGTNSIWTLSADYTESTSGNILKLVMDPAADSTVIDSSIHTVTLYYPSSEDLSAVYFDVLTLSDGASLSSPTNGYLDLSSGSAEMVVKSESGTSVSWAISTQIAYASPKITAMKIAGSSAVIDQDAGTISVSSLPYLVDLTSLAVTGLTFSDGASSADMENNSSYDLSDGKSVTVTSPDGQSKTYTVIAGYQYPNNSFTSWSGNAAANWANGNTSGFNMTTPTNSSSAAKMESMDATILGIGQFASGNIFTGYFNPKSVSSLSMLNDYDDGNELIDFGRPFKGRPKYMEVDFSYAGSGDSCDIYVLLENRTETSNEGKNQYRSSTDVNTLVASAWYRATTDSSVSDPDVVSISGKNSSGFRTLRMKFTYGEPDASSPIYESNTFVTSLKNSNGIDNHLVLGSGNEDVTHIRIVIASSAQGNMYKGTVGATLIVDEIRLIY